MIFLTAKERARIVAARDRGIARIKASAMKYVLVKRFNRLSRAGLKMGIEEGLVEITDTLFGRAYQLTEEN